MKLSVVILNYNVRYFLELCLKSVQQAISTIEAEIIVVDNNSTDDSCDMVQDLFPKVILIQNQENLGFSKGNNLGVLQAKGEYVCILNPDTVVAEDTFVKLLGFVESKEKIGVAGCKLINGIGDFLPESKRNIPSPWVAFNKIFGNSKKYYANGLNQNETGKVDILVGAFMFLKRSVYNHVGGFDTEYFMYGEDIDLSYKILKSGFQNYYLGDVIAIHFKGESTLKDNTYAKHFYNAMKIFYKKHFRKNLLFDAAVWIGINFAKQFRSKSKNKIYSPDEYLLISDKAHVKLMSMFSKPVKWDSNFPKVASNTEIIFDSNYIPFKNIIEQMSTQEKKVSLTFKILPKNSNFIIGSNSTESRGEVITF